MNAQVGGNYQFDATQYQPDAGLEAIPADWYPVKVESTEIKDMANDESGQSKGYMLKVGYEVESGPYQGRKLFNNYNVGHKTSPDNVRIAQSQLSAVCHVTGIFKLSMNPAAPQTAAAELRGARLRVRVTNDGTYNNIKEVADVNGNKPARAGAGAAPPQTAPVAVATPGAAGGAWAAAPAAAPAGAWGQPPAAAPAAPPVAAPAAPAPAPVFPPAGWAVHPQNPAYFFKDQEVLTEADLRAKYAAPVAPAAPAVPTAPAAAPAPQPAWNQAAAAPAAGGAPWGPPAA